MANQYNLFHELTSQAVQELQEIAMVMVMVMVMVMMVMVMVMERCHTSPLEDAAFSTAT